MEISFADLKEKEIINIFDGKKLGHINDIVFNIENGIVQGVFVPGEKKFFRKSEDVFVPLEKIRKIGDDVVLVKLQVTSDNLIRNSQSKGEMKMSNGYMMNNYYREYDNRSNNYKCQNNNLGGKYQKLNNGNASQVSYVRFKPINNIKYK